MNYYLAIYYNINITHDTHFVINIYRKKKTSRLAAPPDFSRSISVPADRIDRLGKCDKTNNNHIVTAVPMQTSQSDDRYC